MSTRTWEVKLDTAGNGLVQVTVEAEAFEATTDGVTFLKDLTGERVRVAYYPAARLIGIKDVTP